MTTKSSALASVILKHRPSLTLKSYGSNVDYCRCENFTPRGEDEESWNEWAKHIADEWTKYLTEQIEKKPRRLTCPVCFAEFKDPDPSKPFEHGIMCPACPGPLKGVIHPRKEEL